MADNSTIVTGYAPNYGRGDWGDKRFDKYYNKYLDELPRNYVSSSNLYTQRRSTEELARDVAAYLDPQMNTMEKNLRRDLRNTGDTIDTEGASRGMTRSTWITDEKSGAYNAGMQNLANAYANYNEELASSVAAQMENDAARQQAIDQQNAQNKWETDKFNSQIDTAIQAKAFERANEAWKRSRPKPRRSGGTTPPKVIKITGGHGGGGSNVMMYK